jgi:hypothetical protein
MRPLPLCLFGLLAACQRGDLPSSPGLPTLDAASADIVVSSAADDGPGTLRQAIIDVPDGGTIGFAPTLAGGTIALASRLLITDKALTVEAPADRGITISGDGVTEIFFVTTTGGLTLRNATVTGARGPSGGIASGGAVTIEHSTISGNQSLLEGASGEGYGGGIVHFGGDLKIVNSTITGNFAEQRGGGIASISSTGTITLVHSTVVGNTSEDYGGGISLSDDNMLLTYQNSIVALNSSAVGANCYYQPNQDLTFLGTNLFGDAGCSGRPEDIIGDPVLGALADNGGPSRTRALLPGSPAIEAAVQACAAVPNDQRYVARPQGTACDIGAFEFDGFVTPPLAISAGGTVDPNNGTAIVSGGVVCPAPNTLTLRVTLRQSQKLARVTTTVEATGDVAVACGGSKPWSIALAPTNGGFRSGTGTVSVRTLAAPAWFTANEASRSVKLSWGRK